MKRNVLFVLPENGNNPGANLSRTGNKKESSLPHYYKTKKLEG
jgi:hypothetical protein